MSGAVFSLSSVQLLVCGVFSRQLVLCAVSSLCYMQLTVMILVASLRACLASLSRAYACMHIFEAGQNQSWCADCLGRTFVRARNEIPPYVYVCIDIAWRACSHCPPMSADGFEAESLCEIQGRVLSAGQWCVCTIHICVYIYTYIYIYI